VAQFAQGRRRVTLEDLDQAFKAGEREELLLIIKGDVSGSVEAWRMLCSSSMSAKRSACA